MTKLDNWNDVKGVMYMEDQLLPLTIGITTRAMFDLSEEHAIFEKDGVHTYCEYQREREDQPLKPGAAFNVIQRLLALNEGVEELLVEVVMLSKNSPDLSLRAFKSFAHHKLPIKLGSFTSGRSVTPFASAWNVDLFLSNDEDDVRIAGENGIAAARLGPSPRQFEECPSDEVHFALDGDAVIFGDESDNIYKNEGLDAFMKHEQENASIPMKRGPFAKTFLPKLAELRRRFMREDGTSRVRISIVTARNAPAHERVVQTLRDWGTPADEAHFVGRNEKAPILKATRAHIFFDDQEKHVQGASSVIPSGHVPGPHQPEILIVPAE